MYNKKSYRSEQINKRARASASSDDKEEGPATCKEGDDVSVARDGEKKISRPQLVRFASLFLTDHRLFCPACVPSSLLIPKKVSSGALNSNREKTTAEYLNLTQVGCQTCGIIFLFQQT